MEQPESDLEEEGALYPQHVVEAFSFVAAFFMTHIW
jgi:hypothetical protein